MHLCRVGASEYYFFVFICLVKTASSFSLRLVLYFIPNNLLFNLFILFIFNCYIYVFLLYVYI
jgi:hypothetical protein